MGATTDVPQVLHPNAWNNITRPAITTNHLTHVAGVQSVKTITTNAIIAPHHLLHIFDTSFVFLFAKKQARVK
ncbi:MAG: hypothetical protein ABIH59_03155 [archaeon]